mgnify:CR=1 FL=1
MLYKVMSVIGWYTNLLLVMRRPPRTTQHRSSAASDDYKKKDFDCINVFDSLSTDPKFVEENLRHLGSSFEISSTATQPESSTLCGEYCIFALVMRTFNLDLDYTDFLQSYLSTDKSANEESVKNFMSDVDSE